MTLEEKIDQVPDRPGVYLYKDAKAQIIYVGKAASLRSRVRSYFQESRARDPKTDALVGQIRDLEYIVTANELEAMILESTLVKKHRPRYNIILRDDKHYPFLKLTTNEEFPRLVVARRVQKDGATYFGPFYPATAMRETLRLVRQLFPLRTCRIKIDGTLSAPVPAVLHPPLQCPLHGLGDRGGVCADGSGRGALPRGQERRPRGPAHPGDGDRGRGDEVRAGRRPARPHPGAQHGAGAPADDLHRGRRTRTWSGWCARARRPACSSSSCARGGCSAGSRSSSSGWPARATARSSPPSSASSTPRTWCRRPRSCSRRRRPRSTSPGNGCVQRRGGRVELLAPQRGRKRDLVAMAEENAALALQTHLLARGSRQQVVLEDLERSLALPGPPHRIECFDISTHQGRRRSRPWWCGRTAT